MTISIGIYLPHSWSKSRKIFSSSFHKRLTKNKSFEWQTDYWGWAQILDIRLELIPFGKDHAGIGFDITLFGFMVSAMIYDNRHWNDETNAWEVYSEYGQ